MRRETRGDDRWVQRAKKTMPFIRLSPPLYLKIGTEERD